MKDLANKTHGELLQMTREMCHILEHNYIHMVQASRAEVFTLKQTLNEQFS